MGSEAYEPGEQVEFLSTGLRGAGWYTAEFVSASPGGLLRIRPPDLQPAGWIEVHVQHVRKWGGTVTWWEASISIRALWGEHRNVELTARTGIQVAWRDDPQERREAAKRQAEVVFRQLGLGMAMDLPGAVVSIGVIPA